MADVFFRLSYNSFTIICSHANFLSLSLSLSLSLFVVVVVVVVDRQNTYSCKSDLFANFSVVYIFPCTLNANIT